MIGYINIENTEHDKVYQNRVYQYSIEYIGHDRVFQ